MERVAGGVGEHRVGRTAAVPVAPLAVLPPREDCFGVGVEVDASPAGSGLDWYLGGPSADDLAAPGDGEPVSVGIPVAPPESSDLAAAHAGCGCDVKRRVEAEMLGFRQEFCELFDGPAFRPGAFAASGSWRLGCVGDVGRHQVVALSRAQGCADYHVDVVDGLRCQSGCSFSTSGEEVGVEAVEMLCS